MSEADILGVNIETAPAPKAPRAKAAVPIAGLPKTIKIILEENDNIPPTGLFLGVNGKGYMLRPGIEVNIPYSVKEVLDHAVMSTPQIDPQTNKIVGYRDRMKYPYRTVS